MISPHLHSLALDLDDALDELEHAAKSYIDAAHEENREYMRTGPGAPSGTVQVARPHPTLERCQDFIRFAAAGHTDLARILGLRPTNAGYKLANIHEKEGVK